MSSHLTRDQKNLWEKQIEESRHSDFTELKLWLTTHNVSFQEKTNGIHINNIFITNFLKVYFGNTKKGYQYNIEGIKNRLSEEFSLSV